jgi:HEAT repeat protein
LRRLTSANPDVRKRAAENLGGSRDTRAVDPLVVALADPELTVRWAAAIALGKIGNARAVEPLVAALRSSREFDGSAAIEALGKIGDARAVEPLVAALRSSRDVSVRSAATKALGKIGDARAVEPLLVALTDTSVGARSSWAGALSDFGDTVRKALVEIDPNWAKTEAALAALPQLVKGLLDSDDENARDNMARALGEIGDPRAVEPLSAVFRDSHSLTVARALGKIGDRRATGPLVEAFASNSTEVREAAADVVKKIDPNWAKSEAARGAIAKLVEAFAFPRGTPHDRYGYLDLGAAKELLGAVEKTLEQIDPSWAKSEAARAAVPRLLEAVRSGTWGPPLNVLGKIGDTRAIEPLVVALAAESWEEHKAVESALTAIDPEWAKSEAAKAAIPELVAAVCHSTFTKLEEETAARALEQIGEAAVGPLVGALTNVPGLHKAGVVETTRRHCDGRTEFHSCPEVHRMVEDTLCRIDPHWGTAEDARAAVPKLIKELKDYNWCVRRRAASALGDIGDSTALQPLKAALNDPVDDVRDTAKSALHLFGRRK